MALSEKSNSAYLATQEAYRDVIAGKIYPIPEHLKNNPVASKKYKYPHNFANDYVVQQYLPTKLKKQQYYHAKKHNTYEKK